MKRKFLVGITKNKFAMKEPNILKEFDSYKEAKNIRNQYIKNGECAYVLVEEIKTPFKNIQIIENIFLHVFN